MAPRAKAQLRRGVKGCGILSNMQIPIRKSEQFKKYSDAGGAIPLTTTGIERLKATLLTLEQDELPQAIADMHRTAEMGDFSENAAYQEAKGRLRRINSRILLLKDRLARAQPILKKHTSGFIALGSTVVIKTGGQEKTYEIVGPAETNPSRGRISHLSPLGEALIGHAKGDRVKFSASDRETVYEILEVR